MNSPLNRTYYRFGVLYLFALVVMLLLGTVLAVGGAWGASLRICYVDPLPNADIATAPAFVNGSPLAPDLLVGSTSEIRCVGGPVSGDPCTASSTCQGGTCQGMRCSITPIPPTILRGTNQDVTMKYVNTLGEVGPASDAKTFRLPSLGPKPVVNSVQIVSP